MGLATCASSCSASGTDPFHDQTWELRAAWDGSIAIAFDAPEEDRAPEAVLAREISETWKLAQDLARQLGGRGAHYIAVRLTGRQFVPAPSLRDDADVNDDTDDTDHEEDANHDDEVDDADVNTLPLITRGPMSAAAETGQRERLQREIERVAGRFAFEPEPDDGP